MTQNQNFAQLVFSLSWSQEYFFIDYVITIISLPSYFVSLWNFFKELIYSNTQFGKQYQRELG